MAYYLARDKNGILCFYDKKPTRHKEEIEWWSSRGGSYLELLHTKFVNVKWEDKQPTKVKLVRADS